MNCWVVNVHNVPRRSNVADSTLADPQRGQTSWAGNAINEQSPHWVPSSRGSSAGHVNSPGAIGTDVAVIRLSVNAGLRRPPGPTCASLTAASRSSTLRVRIVPCVFGSPSTNSTYRGTMNFGIRGTRNSMSSSGVSSSPGRTTTQILISSSVSSDGTATAADSATFGMLAHERLDLERRDVLAAPADRVLHAVDEVVVAVLVVAEAVAGVEPAVAPRRRGLLGHAVVAGVHHPRVAGAHDQLADDVPARPPRRARRRPAPRSAADRSELGRSSDSSRARTRRT